MERFGLLILAGLLITACAAPSETIEVFDRPSLEDVSGGYAPANLNDEWTKDAQSLAIDAVYDKYPSRALVGRTEAYVQVVAGLNYLFLIEMSGSEDYRSSTAYKKAYEVQVYRDFNGNMEITKVEQVRGG